MPIFFTQQSNKNKLSSQNTLPGTFRPGDGYPGLGRWGVGLIILSLMLLLAGCSTTPESPEPEATPTPAPGAHQQAEAAYREKDYQQVRRILEPLAEQGDATAQYIIGYMYYYGQGVATNTDLARQWIGRAAEQGHNKARVALEQLEQARLEQIQAAQDTSQPSRLRQITEPPEQPPQPIEPLPASGSMSDEEAPATEPAAEPETTKESTEQTGQAAPWDTPAQSMPSVSEVRSNAWVLTQPSAHYTIQLLAARDEQAVIDFITRHNMMAEAAYYGFMRQGERWYAVIYGSYGSSADARAALNELDPALRKQSPWVRSYSAIQALAR